MAVEHTRKRGHRVADLPSSQQWHPSERRLLDHTFNSYVPRAIMMNPGAIRFPCHMVTGRSHHESIKIVAYTAELVS